MLKQVTAIIPARKGSKGLPNKNILTLNGKPLIHYTIEAALKVPKITEIVVTTDDDRVKKIASDNKVKVIDRPTNLADDSASQNDVILDVLEKIKSDHDENDILILLQPTSPLRNASHLNEALEMFLQSMPDSLISVCENPHPVEWTLLKTAQFLTPLFEQAFFKQSRQSFPITFIPNGAIYISTFGSFRKNKSFYTKKMVPYFMSRESSVDIDTKLDFELVKTILNDEKNIRS